MSIFPTSEEILNGYKEQNKDLMNQIHNIGTAFVHNELKISTLNNVFECMVSLGKNVRKNKMLQKTITKERLIKMICELYDMAEKALKEQS